MGAYVAGPRADHSAAMRLSSCLLYNRCHVTEPRRCSEHFPLFLLSLAFPPARLPAGCTVQCFDVSCGDDRPERLKL